MLPINNPLVIITVCFVIWLLVKGPVDVADTLNTVYHHLTAETCK